MITPQRMSEFEKNKIIDMFSKLNQDLTSSIIKKLQKNEDISSFTKAQMRVLARQGGKEVFNEALNKVNGLSRERKKQLLQLFEELQNEQMKGYKETYEAKGLEYEISREVQTLVDSIYRQTDKELKNMTKSIAFASKEAYINGVDDLYTKVASGSFDYSSAMKSTINALAEKGITLKDSAGRNTTLETAVKRNLMTSLTQTANDIAKQVGDEIGANCVVIGHTPYCRPTHRVIDGVVMSLDKFKRYEYLTKEANCYHIVNYDWREEFENKKDKVRDNGHLTNAQYNKNYEIRQKQTYYARQVRDKKEQVAILEKSDKRNNTTNEELIKAKKELRNAQMKFRQFSKSNGIDVDYELVWKQGYNK